MKKRKDNNYVSLAYPPKEYYPLPDKVKALLLTNYSKEEIDTYYRQIEYAKDLNICLECGQGVIFNEEHREEHIKEYSISALCKHCQEKIFGA